MKIWIRGVSCSGKSTLAKKLSKELNLPHIELDQLYWLPEWNNREKEEFLELVSSKLNQKDWVMDGNYRLVANSLNPQTDYVLWLNYPFFKVMFRCVGRTFSRVVRKTSVCNCNRENFRQQFTLEGSIFVWVLRTYRLRRKQLADLKKTSTKVVEIRHGRDIERFIQEVRL